MSSLGVFNAPVKEGEEGDNEDEDALTSLSTSLLCQIRVDTLSTCPCRVQVMASCEREEGGVTSETMCRRFKGCCATGSEGG